MPADTASRLAELKKQLQEAKPRGPAPKPMYRPRRVPRRRSEGIARTRSVLGRILWAALKAGAIIVLPLVVCVRVATFLYSQDAATTLSVAGGAWVAVVLVAWYAASLSHRFTGRARVLAMTKWVALPLVVGWCGYALFYLASANAKTPTVQSSFTAVHPILRIALSTAILAEDELVVTDMQRAPADYARMGLPVFDRTLHYRQRDGWVHAVDLRTIGRSELRNWGVKLYFGLMGFRTVRHVGTADHLHVELPPRPRT